MGLETEPMPLAVLARRGRPRSESAHRAILEAFRELLLEDGFARLRLEHVAARAGVSKATIYRRWSSKEELAIELLQELASSHVPVAETGDSRRDLVAVTQGLIERLTTSSYGPVIRALLCEIAATPAVGDRFRASVIEARREEIRGIVERGVARGDLRPSTDPELATELLVGPVCLRLVLGEALTAEFGAEVVGALLTGYAVDH
jgi:AcrR family transcriptional regulator